MATYAELAASRKEIINQILAIASDPFGDEAEVARLRIEAQTISRLMDGENPSAEEMQGVAITS